MAREYTDGLADLSGGYNVTASIPIDTRIVIPTFNDLCASTTWIIDGVSTCYPGIIVTLLGRNADGTISDAAGVYYYKGTDPSQFSTADNWVKISGNCVETLIGQSGPSAPPTSDYRHEYWLDTTNAPQIEKLYKKISTSISTEIEWNEIDPTTIAIGTHFVDVENEINYIYGGEYNWVTDAQSDHTTRWNEISI